jgi:hypothetical protein
MPQPSETDEPLRGATAPQEHHMHDDTRPWDNLGAPAHGAPPLDAYLTLTRLEDAVERLQPLGETEGEVLPPHVLRVTTGLLTLAQRLLRGWQAQQAEVQTCLATWRQQAQTLETTGMLMQTQAALLREQTAQLHHAPWWAFLAGVGLMGLVALGMTRMSPPPPISPTLQMLPSLPHALEQAPPSEAPPGMTSDMPPASEADGALAGTAP